MKYGRYWWDNQGGLYWEENFWEKTLKKWRGKPYSYMGKSIPDLENSKTSKKMYVGGLGHRVV